MWELSNYNQLITFVLSVCTGAICCAFYDVIRAMRRVCLNSLLAITIGDVLLWIFYAFVTFVFLISRTNGEIRVYVLLGEFLGFVLFRATISKVLFPTFRFLFIKLSVLISKISELLDMLYSKFEHLFSKILKLLIKICKSAKKLLKNIFKLLYTNINIC